MSQDDAKRILAAAHSLRSREGPGFALTRLARPAGMSRATLYRRLAADQTLAMQVHRIRCEGALDARDELVKAATDLLAEKGLHAWTMDEVALCAGLSTATLYRHFEDREHLVREVLRRSAPVRPIRDILQESGTIEEILVGFVDAALNRLREQPHILRLFLLGNAEDIDEIRKLRRAEERLSTALIDFFERKQSDFASEHPKQLAASLMGQVVGALIFQKAHESTEMIDAQAIVRLFLHGARRRNTKKRGPDGQHHQ